MKIETTVTTKVVFSDLINDEEFKLDPVTVYLENYEPGKGKIIVECYGKSWSASWGAMSGDSVEVFVARVAVDYLIGNFAPSLRSLIYDPDEAPGQLRKQIIKLRRDHDMNQEEAREFFDRVADVDHETPNSDLYHGIFGDDWWYCLPETPNPEYLYLERIVRAVKKGLKIYIENRNENG